MNEKKSNNEKKSHKYKLIYFDDVAVLDKLKENAKLENRTANNYIINAIIEYNKKYESNENGK